MLIIGENSYSTMMNSKIKQIKAMKQDLNNLFARLDAIATHDQVSGINLLTQDPEDIASQIKQLYPDVEKNLNRLLVLQNIIELRNNIAKYEIEQDELLAAQGVSLERISSETVALNDHFIDEKEESTQKEAISKMTILQHYSGLFHLLNVDSKVLSSTIESELAYETGFNSKFNLISHDGASRMRDIGKDVGSLQRDVITLFANDHPTSSQQSSLPFEYIAAGQFIQFNILPREIQQYYLEQRAKLNQGKFENAPSAIRKDELSPVVVDIFEDYMKQRQLLNRKAVTLSQTGNYSEADILKNLINDSHNENQTLQHFADQMDTSPQKAQMAIKLFEDNKSIISKIDYILQKCNIDAEHITSIRKDEDLRKYLMAQFPELTSSIYLLPRIIALANVRGSSVQLQSDLQQIGSLQKIQPQQLTQSSEYRAQQGYPTLHTMKSLLNQAKSQVQSSLFGGFGSGNFGFGQNLPSFQMSYSQPATSFQSQNQQQNHMHQSQPFYKSPNY